MLDTIRLKSLISKKVNVSPDDINVYVLGEHGNSQFVYYNNANISMSSIKNYLSKEELESLELIVSAFLDLAENRAKRHIPMTMEDWSTRIDKFLLADDLDILKDAGKISHEIAM